MDFTEDEKIALGEFCEVILRSEQFKTLTKYFEDATVTNLLSTKPSDRNGREDAYHAVRGVRDFMSLMVTFVQEKDRLLAPPQELSDMPHDDEDEDA